jgi:hypothetical protein
MVTLEVRFTCETCKTFILHPIRVGPHFFLGSDNLPDGWRIEVSECAIKTWCPEHAL